MGASASAAGAVENKEPAPWDVAGVGVLNNAFGSEAAVLAAEVAPNEAPNAGLESLVGNSDFDSVAAPAPNNGFDSGAAGVAPKRGLASVLVPVPKAGLGVEVAAPKNGFDSDDLGWVAAGKRDVPVVAGVEAPAKRGVAAGLSPPNSFFAAGSSVDVADVPGIAGVAAAVGKSGLDVDWPKRELEGAGVSDGLLNKLVAGWAGVVLPNRVDDLNAFAFSGWAGAELNKLAAGLASSLSLAWAKAGVAAAAGVDEPKLNIDPGVFVAAPVPKFPNSPGLEAAGGLAARTDSAGLEASVIAVSSGFFSPANMF